MNQKVLVITFKGSRIIDPILSMGGAVLHINDVVVTQHCKIINWIIMFNRIRMYFKLHSPKQFERVIIFDGMFLIPVFRLFIAKKRLYAWFWNTVDEKDKKVISKYRKICNMYTFDKKDSQTYSIGLNSQVYVYELPIESRQDSNAEIVFIGMDKGRLEGLKSFDAECKKRNIKTEIRVLADKNKKYSEDEKDYLIYDRISEKKMREMLQKSGVVLDWVKDGQTGITLRTLDAVVYNKKIITNNVNIIDEDLYDRTRIFVIGIDPYDDLELFISEPINPYPKEVINHYCLEEWISRFQ